MFEQNSSGESLVVEYSSSEPKKKNIDFGFNCPFLFNFFECTDSAFSLTVLRIGDTKL